MERITATMAKRLRLDRGLPLPEPVRGKVEYSHWRLAEIAILQQGLQSEIAKLDIEILELADREGQ